ncbi:FAD-binding oxidoreductase [uncultured Shimia sp.]|uniref:NAD(P)/FAD-dependent oxidoreductase n=1 Tax=uncultured Shimia sp. TaxID=573152 RepID=UPI002622F25C|nr:FAD-binding oxidoreductase [uncultured Shimia sp.]
MTRYRARRLPVQQGRAAWNAVLGPAPAPSPLDGDRSTDVVVIGAGFAGLSAARRLKQIDPDLDVVVLEAGHIAEGAAGRNSGFMIDIPHELTSEDYAGTGDDKHIMVLNRQAQAFGAEAVADYGITPDFFEKTGKINGAGSAVADAHNQSLAKHLTALGEPYEMLDVQSMRRITGSEFYRSGLFTPGTVMVQPAGYVRGLAAGLQRDGVSICEDSGVTGFSRQGTGWKVETAKGTVSCARIILTVNGHLESFGFERGRLMQLFLFAVMTPELTAEQVATLGGQSRWGVTPSDPMGTTVRRIDGPLGGNRIVTRSCAALRPNMRTSTSDLERAATVMQKKFDARFPMLKGIDMEHTWAGHLCLSLNGVSVAREVHQGVFSGCVQNGLGIARGTLTGIAAAERCLGASSEIADFFEAQDMPKRLPPQPFQQIGANALLRWKEWRAGLE